jgi:glutamate synthase (NADPH) small chain
VLHVEHAFNLGFVQPRIPEMRTGKKVAVIGSGPAGLAVADLLNQAGHEVTVYEKDNAAGGLLRYGIPDFKLTKTVIDRRLKVLKAEGVIILTGRHVGVDITTDELLAGYDAIILATGAGQPRDLPIEGRNLGGIHFAMDFLTQQNMRVAADEAPPLGEIISAHHRQVLVIGGGDTGSDCVGTAIRQKAYGVTQIEILPKPSEKRSDNNPWPWWPDTLRTSSSHLEGCERRWGLSAKRFIGEKGYVKGG